MSAMARYRIFRYGPVSEKERAMTQSLPRHIAVIDIGKTNAKVVLIDAASEALLGTRSRPNSVRRDAPYPHADVEGLWEFILASLGVSDPYAVLARDP